MTWAALAASIGSIGASMAGGTAVAGTAAGIGAGTAAGIGAGAAGAGALAAGAGGAGAAGGGGLMSSILPSALGSMMSTMSQPSGQGIPGLLGGAAKAAGEGGAAIPNLGGGSLAGMMGPVASPMSAIEEAMQGAPPMMPAPMQQAPMPGPGSTPPVPLTPQMPNNFDFGGALKQGLAGSATAMDLALKYKMANGQRPAAPAANLRGTATPAPKLGQAIASPMSPLQRYAMMFRRM